MSKSANEKKRRQRVYVGFKFPHMGAHSGYDHIKDYVRYDKIVDCQRSFNWVSTFLSKRTVASRIWGRLFGYWLWWIELELALMALWGPDSTFHFVYAENSFRYLWLFRMKRHRFVCTFHQPSSFFIANPELVKGAGHCDDVILLGPDEKSYFEQFIHSKRIHVIPHGIDTEFFSQGTKTRAKEVLMVGNWLRNFEFANRLFSELLKIDDQVNVHVVASASNLAKFQPHSRMTLHHKISDVELLERYQSAAILFLPLNGFVANNAVLEAASCACPVMIASDQPYNESTSPIPVVKMDISSCLAKIITWLNNSGEEGATQRKWVVERFAWSVIGKQTSDIMDAVDEQNMSNVA